MVKVPQRTLTRLPNSWKEYAYVIKEFRFKLIEQDHEMAK